MFEAVQNTPKKSDLRSSFFGDVLPAETRELQAESPLAAQKIKKIA